MTLALANNPASATLGGTLTVTAVGGVATFSGLTLDKPGSGYTLTATNDGLTSATSATFAVTADHLVVTAQPPGSITAGVPFGLVAASKTIPGTVDASYNGSVTVSEFFVADAWWDNNGDGGQRHSRLLRSDARLRDSQLGVRVPERERHGMPSSSTDNLTVIAAAATKLDINYVGNVGVGVAVQRKRPCFQTPMATLLRPSMGT